MPITEHEQIDWQDIPAIIKKIETALNDQVDFDDDGTQTITGAKTYSDLVRLNGGLNISGTLVSATAAELNKLAGTDPVYAKEVTFTETSGAGTYTGAVVVPAGATLIDIIVNGVALWDNSGTAVMKVGDTDDDGFFTNINLKATDLLAGESISFALAGGKAGEYIANSHVSPRYSASERTINGIITTSSTGGSAGRTRMTVIWSKPAAGNIVAATKA
jgi:hypothetical protein